MKEDISSWSIYLAPKYPYPVSASRSFPEKAKRTKVPLIEAFETVGQYVDDDRFMVQKYKKTTELKTYLEMLSIILIAGCPPSMTLAIA